MFTDSWIDTKVSDPAFAAQLRRGGDAYEIQMDLVEGAVFQRGLKGSTKDALAWLRAHRPDEWDRPRAVRSV